MASALRLHPLLVIFGLLAGGELYGIPGVLVALPTMAALRAIWEFFRERIDARAVGRRALAAIETAESPPVGGREPPASRGRAARTPSPV